MSSNLNLDQVADNQSNKEVTINDMSGQVDAAITEEFTANMTSGNVSVTSAQYRAACVITCSGHAVARDLTLPAVKRQMTIRNDGTGSGTVSIKRGSTTLSLVIGDAVTVYTDGTTDGLRSLLSASVSSTPTFTRIGVGAAPDASAAGKFAGQYYAVRYAATVSMDFNNSNVQSVTLANGSNSITLANGKAGGRYLLELKQPASGAAGTVSWPGTVDWGAAGAPTLTATNGKTDLIALYFNGTNYAASYALGFTI